MRISKFQVRDWWMRLRVAMQSAALESKPDDEIIMKSANGKIIFNVLQEMRLASESKFPTCANCGKRMPQAVDPIQKKKSEYLYKCNCTPNINYSIG